MHHLPDPELNSLKRRWFAFTFAFTLVGLLFLSACQKTGTGPGTTPPAPPDTTSHNFSWQTFTFGGQHGSSVLQDVAIINENDIWAVGEIHTAQTDTYDSLGNWQLPFNAVHWDGVKWELKRIPFIGACSAVDFPTLRAIWAFENDNVYFTNGGSLVHYNGNGFNMDCGMNSLLSGAINKILGISPSDIYAVGGKGSIVHYDGQGWQKIESGTTTNINDVWGYVDPKSGGKTVLAAVSSRYHSGQIRLLSIKSGSATDTLETNLNRVINGVWFGQNTPLYVVGDGLRMHTEQGWQKINIPPYFSTRIRGTAVNNIFVVGAFGLVVHYNGNTWRSYPELMMNNGSLEGLDMKTNIVAAVGENTIGNYRDAAVIIIGK